MKYEIKKQKLKNNETMAYRETGKGSVNLILIHGNQSSSLFYENVMHDFEDKVHIYAIDMIGFGESSYNNAHLDMKSWAYDVRLFMDELKIENAIIVGWSAGGGTALEMAINYPDRVKHLVLLASVGVKGFFLQRMNEDMTPVDGEFVYKRKDVEKDPKIVKPVQKAIDDKNEDFLCNVWKAGIFNLNQPKEELFRSYMKEILKERCFVDISVALCNFNITDEDAVVRGDGRIKDIKCPVTWIHGKKDLVVPFEQGQDSIRYFKSKSELIPIENAGHASFMDRPDEFNEILSNIIKMY